MIYFFTKKISTRRYGKEAKLSDACGMTLLIVMVLMTAILSISLGVFNVILGQFLISGDVQSSFTALAAADQGIEKWLFVDRMLLDVSGNISGPSGALSSGACYNYEIDKSSGTTISTYGLNNCAVGAGNLVKRGLQVSY